MLKGENSTPLDVIIYMLEINNQQRKTYIRQKGVTPLRLLDYSVSHVLDYLQLSWGGQFKEVYRNVFIEDW